MQAKMKNFIIKVDEMKEATLYKNKNWEMEWNHTTMESEI